LEEEQELRPLAFVIADTETTGLNGPACEIALREICPDTLDVIGEIQSLIDPECEIEPGAEAIHGISQAMVADAPTLDEFISVKGYLDGAFDGRDIVLIAHNAPFDYKRLTRIGNIVSSVCTLFHARQMWPKDTVGDHKLGTLRAHFGFPVNEAHRAMADVATTHRLLKEILAGTNRTLRDFMATENTTVHKMPWGLHQGKQLMDLPPGYMQWLWARTELEVNLRNSLEKAMKLMGVSKKSK
jgi:DNA polymerase III epsilon subunit-like protein